MPGFHQMITVSLPHYALKLGSTQINIQEIGQDD